MKKAAWVIGSISLVLVGLLAAFSMHWMKHSYKEKEGKVLSISFRAKGLRAAPELELCKAIGDPYPVEVDTRKIREYEARLKNLPMIKEASVSKRKSNLAFSYTMREPLFELADYENVAIDKEGTLFPLYPFYHAAKRVKLVLGCEFNQAPLGQVIEDVRFELASDLLELFERTLPEGVELKLIDVTLSDAMSLGQRQVLAHFDWQGHGVYALFYPRQMDEVVSKVAAVMKLEVAQSPCMSVDLRVEGRAYIKVGAL